MWGQGLLEEASCMKEKVKGWWHAERQARSWRRVLLEILFEVLLVVVFLKAYNLVRNQFGSLTCEPKEALRHALQVISAERALGFFWEQQIQAMVINWKSWIRLWNIFYGSAHMAVTVFVLGYLFALKPGAYQYCRTVFIIMNVLAISGYAGYPLMPPRLVNSCDEYGGCDKHYAFEDTLHTVGGLWSWKDKAVSKVSNHYAAMPSMHAGYSLWCSMSMYAHAPHALFRTLALVYPFLTLYCIVVTANHYFMDAVFGSLAYIIASKVAVYMPRVGRGADEIGEPSTSSASGTAVSNGYLGADDAKVPDQHKGMLLPVSVPGGDEAAVPLLANGAKGNGPSNGVHVHATATIKSVSLANLQKR